MQIMFQECNVVFAEKLCFYYISKCKYFDQLKVKFRFDFSQKDKQKKIMELFKFV